MIGAPVGLVFMQPDLGTALLLAATGVIVIFVAGLSWRIGFAGVFGGLSAAYGAYRFDLLQDYQVRRITNFLDPDRDPLGQGYHLLQSKIALGSGGLDGQGYMQGAQSQLKFLPEMQTDFIFTIFGEEFGFVGAVGLLLLYLAVILTGLSIAMASKSHFFTFGRDRDCGYFCVICADQYRHGDGAGACRRRAATAGFLWRHGNADNYGRIWRRHERACSPRSGRLSLRRHFIERLGL